MYLMCALVSRMGYRILDGSCCRIRRMIEYSSDVCIGQPDGVSNIVWVVVSD